MRKLVSGSVKMIALTRGSTLSIRLRSADVTSTGDKLPDR